MPTSHRTTIVLADDHLIVRQGLRLLLESEPSFSVVGEAADGLDAVREVERLEPDVVVVDIVMPGLGGLDVAAEVAKRSPKTRVVILSMYGDDVNVLEALRQGVSGYVLKGSNAQELIRAIREAAAGRHYLAPPLAQGAIEAFLQRSAQQGASLDPYDTLTAREREVLHLAAEGLSSTEIAQRLCISPRTAETHRAHAMRKLGLRNRTDLVRYALKRGILHSDMQEQAVKKPPRAKPQEDP